jgi:2,5-furandicarboxylate decarboxylase 1
MNLNNYIEKLKQTHQLVEIKQPVSKSGEASAILKHLESRPVLLSNILESNFPVIGNLFCSKSGCADYLNIPLNEVIHLLAQAISNRSSCQVVSRAPCHDVIITHPDLDDLPILKHFPEDGGNYVTSGVLIAQHPQFGVNLDFHRLMQFSKKEFSVRVVRGRHFDRFLQDLHQVDVAVCIGVPLNVLLAAAISVDIGINELEIANSLQPVSLVKAKSVNLFIPAEAEFILEGTVYLDRKHTEGPFVDLTETKDIIRYEPVFEVKTITHRTSAVWHALLPGGLEHKLLMGMPREPTIFEQVNKVVKCLDVNINPGGCSWLHAIIQIEKHTEEDGPKAIHAAFAGHTSCKHVFVVDQDINIYDPLEVEWAMATRFQGDRDLVMIGREPGSSLDPSGEPDTNRTMKLGFDLTKPPATNGKKFDKVPYPKIDIDKYLPLHRTKS